jgi:DNA-binding CsgD family transcriptional regulator
MSLEAIDEMLTARLSSAFSHPTLLRIHQTSGGNPFFAIEIGRFIMARGVYVTAGSTVPLPENLRELVRGRLASLSRSARDALLGVAAASHPTESMVIALVGKKAAAAGLSRAIEARIVETSTEGRLRFTHPLIASVLYEDSSAERRRQLHRELTRLVPEPGEQARHLALSTNPPDSGVAAALERGAESADCRGAPDVAAWLMEQAVAFTGPGHAPERNRRQLRSADYQFRAGDTQRARSALDELVSALPAGRQRAAVLQRLGRAAFWESEFLRAEDVLSQALVEAGDEVLRASVERDLVLLLSEAGKLEPAAQHARKLHQDAERLRDPELLMMARALDVHVQCLRGRGVPTDVRPVAFALAHMPPQQEAHPGWVDPLMYWGAILKWSDDFDSARRIFGVLLERMSEEHDESSLGSCLFQLAELECWAGNYDQGLQLAERARRSVVHAGHPSYLYLIPIAMVAAVRGSVDEARVAALEAETVARNSGQSRFLMRALAVLGFIELSRGEPVAAIPYFARLREIAETQGFAEPGVLRFDADQIEALVAAAQLEEADRLTDQLEQRGRNLQRVSAIAAGARCRGLIMAVRGDLDGALQALDRALEAHSHVTQPLELARTFLVLGTIRRRAKQRRLARESLERAATMFDQLRATLWARRARSELARIGGRSKSGLVLTTTERRVAELATLGHTNREIASLLFMTVRTVEANLSRIYGKLEVRSKAELVSRMLSTPPYSGVFTDSPAGPRP